MVEHLRKICRKRSWLLVGCLFLFAGGSDASQPLQQHPVPPSQRRVLYDCNRRIPSKYAAHYDQTESGGTERFRGSKQHAASQRRKQQQEEAGHLWHVHVDATNEPQNPDELFEEIRRSSSGESEGQSRRNNDSETAGFFSFAFPFFGRTKKNNQWNRWLRRATEVDRRKLVEESQQSDLLSSTEVLAAATATPLDLLVEDAFVDESDGVIDGGGDGEPGSILISGDGNETSATTVGFNVSVDTKYNVSDTVIFDGSNNETAPEVDSSTVIFTSNEGGTLNSSNTEATFSNGTDQQGSNGASYNQSDDETGATSTEGPPPRVFRPIRMRAFLSELAGGGQHLTEPQRTILMQQIVKPALLSWSAALRVEPVQGNLTVDSHQLLDGISCGPGPNVVVPTSHLTTGVSDTDFILYISLAFANHNISANNETSTMLEDGPFSQDDSPSMSPTSDTSRTVEQILAKQSCAGDYLAASAFCSTDQFDRPTAAILHLCINEDAFWLPSSLPTNIMTMKHEIGHVLGFNGYSLAHFRRADGTPLTRRDPKTGAIPLQNITCTGPVGQRRRETVALPGPDILQFRTVRGGVRVAEVVTPSVRQVVRNHFDCPQLPGAELESGEFLPLSTHQGQSTFSCIGDHWERRLFKTDLMNPLVDENMEFNPRFSTITLAYFADSGWYQVDLSRTSMAAGWGRAAGCDFVEETCIHDGQVPPRFGSFFCNQASERDDYDGNVFSDIHGCTPDLSRKATCALDSYEGELPPEYQYFNFMYGANVGGNDPFMDYCPVYAGFADGLCADPRNEAVIKVNLVERIGRRNSRCLAGTFQTDKAGTWENQTAVSQSTQGTGQTALCLPIACVVEDRSLRIQVDGHWEVCHRQGDIIVPRSLTFSDRSKAAGDSNILQSIICPDPIRICPTFYCRRDCLGTNRVCDYNVGKCVCQHSSAYDNSTIAGTMFGEELLKEDDESGLCIRVNATENNTEGQRGSFYSPDEQEENGNLPSPDSPLADYYVPKARDLRDESDGFFSERWKKIVSAVVATLSLALGLYFYFRIFKKRRTSRDNDAVDDAPINPEKHKMIASVVVDMRMNDPNLQRRDALGNRDSETDLSMTDTEGTGADVNNSLGDIELTPSLQQQYESSEQYARSNSSNSQGDHSDVSPGSGRLNSNEDEELYIDPLAPPATEAPMLVRRRHKPLQASR